ncbi:MAG: type II CAAX endopeptidase family protein [Chloroflexi bacterium]|nr:type II CAAX endopeptidase family protein [Chloroflexota bacterium]
MATSEPTPETNQPKTRAFPNVLQALVLLGLLLILQLGVTVVVGFYLSLQSIPMQELSTVLAMVNLSTFGAVVILGTAWSRVSARQLFYLRGFSPMLILPMFVMMLGLIIVVSELDNVLQRFLPIPDWLIEMLGELGLGEGFMLGTFIVLVVVAPITEEPLFRGILLHGFTRNYGAWWAVIVTAFLFGAIHMNPWQFVGAFFLGLAFGWWTLETRSILPAILGHAMNNGMVVITVDVLSVEIQGFNAWEEGVQTHQPWWFTLAGVVLLVVGAGILYKLWVQDRQT